MAKELTFGISTETAKAEATQIGLYFKQVEELGKQASNTMLSICPILNHLKASNGWILLDEYTPDDGNHSHRTFGKWAEAYFNKPHSTMSETISVAQRFFDEGGNLKNPELYNDYSYTQLLRMRKFDDAQIEEYITPNMSTAEIRKKVAEVTKAALPEKQSDKNTETMNTGVPDAVRNMLTEVELPEQTEPETKEVSRETLDTVSVSDLPPEIANAIIAIMDVNGIDEITITR